jgi:hypothetical protein
MKINPGNKMSDKRTIELTDEFIEHIVIEELKWTYEMNLVPDTDEGGAPIDPDGDLLGSIETLLKYFMPYREAIEYIEGKRTK